MTGFEIKVEKGPWNLEIILEYIRKLQEMKCCFELSCDKEVYAINKEDCSSICKNHYSSSISEQNELKEKYERINDIVRDIENTFIEFQDTFINVKANIAIFKSNKVALINYKELLEEIEKTEKHLDFQVAKIVGYPSEAFKANLYNIYLAMKREMNLTIPDIEKIHNLGKQVIYRLFNKNLIYTLNQAGSEGNEEFKYDLYSTPTHPIFGKELTLYTMVCQDSK